MITRQKANSFKTQRDLHSEESMSDYSYDSKEENGVKKTRIKKNVLIIKHSKSQPQKKANLHESQKNSLPKGWETLADFEEYNPCSFKDCFESKVIRKKNFRGKFKGMKRPIDFFGVFLNEEVLLNIVTYTNQKAQGLIENSLINSHQKPWENCTLAEIKCFFAIQLHMGITKAPSYKTYWSNNQKFRIQGIADSMTRDRFLQIKKHIYYQDGLITNDKDRLSKIRPIFDSILASCEKYWFANQLLTIDESMISFTGRHSGLVYMPRKPIRNGFKVYVLADSEGYVLRFQPSFLYPPKTKVSAVVFDLMHDLYFKAFHLFMDRYCLYFFKIFIF